MQGQEEPQVTPAVQGQEETVVLVELDVQTMFNRRLEVQVVVVVATAEREEVPAPFLSLLHLILICLCYPAKAVAVLALQTQGKTDNPAQSLHYNQALTLLGKAIH